MIQVPHPLTILPPAAYDPSGVVPIPLVPHQPASRFERIRAWTADGFGALLANLVVVALLVRFAFPALGTAGEPNAITVDLVSEREASASGGQGSQTPPDGKNAGSPSGTASPTVAPQGTQTSDQAPPEPPKASEPAPQPSPGGTPAAQTPAAPPADKPPEQPAPAPDPPPPTPPQQSETLPVPAPTPSAMPSIAQPSSAPSPAPTSAVQNMAEPQPSQPAAPPPLEASAGLSEKPQLVAAPAAPRPAKTQDQTNEVANAVSEPPDPKASDPAGAPVSAPHLLSTQPDDAADPVPDEAPKKLQPPLSAAERKKQAENTAKLAAVLPFSQTIAPSDARAEAAAEGQSANDDYRGAVYGAFKKSDALVEAAKEKHLKGQAVVAFSIDDKGTITSIHIAMSSGNPDIDATALSIIEQAAPFPPPPPGAPHSFSPAIGLGMDE